LEHRFVWCETLTLRKVDQIYLECFEVWCWRRLDMIIWTERVKPEELRRDKKQRNILHTVKEKMEEVWIGHILRRNCLL